MIKIVFMILCMLGLTKSLFLSVPTGNVIVWYNWRVMNKEISEPGGLKFYNPLTTYYQLVDVTSQMD